GRAPLPYGQGLGFINGILNSKADAVGSALYISNMIDGYDVPGVHNATHGLWDVYEYIRGSRYKATTPVRLLHEMWDNFFDNSPAGSKFLQNCHSQGATHVRNALLDYSEERRQRIFVVAIAPGSYIDPKTCAKVIHYRAPWWRDFVPRIDSAGAERAKGTIVDLKSHPDAKFFDHEFQSPTYRGVLKQHIDKYIESGGQSL
ncbi:MAG: DUF687 family protein, partial [Verrucomicrobia bacterium]|nr:DUF687 family protein [Verrucomicrobiota bacterium]